MKKKKIAVDARGLFLDEPRGHLKCTLCMYREVLKLKSEIDFYFYTYPVKKNIGDIFPNAKNAFKVELDPKGSSLINYKFLWREIYWPLSMAKSKMDLLHATCNDAPRICCTSKISTIYDIIPLHYEGNYQEKYKHYKRVLDTSKSIVTCSEYSKKEILELYGNNFESKIHVIPLAIPDLVPSEEAIDKDIILSKLSINKPFILSFGHEDHLRKNTSQLITCFTEFIKAAKEDYQLVITGIKTDSAKNKYKQEAQKLGIEDKIQLPGYLPEAELKPLLQSAEFFMYISLYEGFGLPPLEAMQQGCPVIASNVTSIPEVTGDAAILVDPEDQNDIVKSMLKLSQKTDFVDRLVARGRARIKDFSWNRTASDFANLL